MNELRIRKGQYEYALILDLYKIILVTNEFERMRMIRMFMEIAENQNTEYAEETGTQIRMFINEDPVSSRKVNIIPINIYRSLSQDLKLQAKSILLKSILAELNQPEYTDLFMTIDGLQRSICAQYNEDHSIVLQPSAYTPIQLIKTISPELIVDECVANEFDLSSKDYILKQLEMIGPALKESTEHNIVLLEYPIIDHEILDAVKKLSNCYVLLFCTGENCNDDYRNYAFLNNHLFDPSNEEQLYEEVCCNILHSSDLEEAKTYVQNCITKQTYFK